jgi:hypothetical protein
MTADADNTDNLDNTDDIDDADDAGDVDGSTATAVEPAASSGGGKAAEATGAARPAGRPAEDPPPPNEMLPKEQRLGYMVAAAVVAWVLSAGGGRIVQGKTAYIPLTLLGLAAAGAIFYAARRGRRMFGAIVSVVAGLAVSGFFPLNFGCLIYGGYLMVLQNKAQKKYAQVHPRGAGKSRNRTDQAAGRKGRDQPSTNRPQANRRYTPPKSTKAKDSRRGR